MSGTTYYQRNREVMLNRANEYYENNKEVLREKAKNATSSPEVSPSSYSEKMCWGRGCKK